MFFYLRPFFVIAILLGVTSIARADKWVGFPFVFYTPETGFAGGVTAVYFTLLGEPGRDAGAPSLAGRQSNTQASFTYTERNQWFASVFPNIYYDRGRKAVIASLALQYYPDRFYGIGPGTPDSARENFTSRISRIWLTHLFHVNSAWYAGPVVNYERDELLMVPPGGALASGNVVGSEGVGVLGAGVEVDQDSRDRQFEPYRGMYLQMRAMGYGAGSSVAQPFAAFTLDYRYYVLVGEEKTLAANVIVQQRTNQPPFQFLSLLGGPNTLRGYYQGRYRDRAMTVVQAEYRAPIFWKFRYTLFAGAGSVAPDVPTAASGSWMAAGGAGLRIVLDSTNGMNIRLDAAFGGSDGVYFYFTLGEAF